MYSSKGRLYLSASSIIILLVYSVIRMITNFHFGWLYEILYAVLIFGIVWWFGTFYDKFKMNLEKLRISEQKNKEIIDDYTCLVENVEDIIYKIDKEGKWIFLNSAWERRLGYAVEESLGKPFYTYIHRDDIPVFFKQIKKIKIHKNKNIRAKIRFISQQNEVRWTELNAKVEFSQDGGILHTSGTMRDVTEQNMAEKSAIEASEQLSLIYHSVSDLIYLIKVEEGYPFVSANKSYIEKIGIKENEVENMLLEDVIKKSGDSDDIVRKVKQTFNTVVDQKRRICYQEEVFAHNKRMIFETKLHPIISVSGEVTHILGTSSDITELNKNIKDLSESEERYRSLIELSPDGIFVQVHGKIVYANEQALKLFGANDEEEVIGFELSKFVHPQDHKKVNAFLTDLHDYEFKNLVEYRNIRLDGTAIHVEVGSANIMLQNRPATLCIFRNITNRKIAEEKQEQKNHELARQSEKLSAAGQLAAGIAHEIRNPLTSISGFLQLIEAKSGEEHSEYYSIVKSEVKRIELILNELLVLAKPNIIQFTEVNLIQILVDIITLIETNAILNNVQVNKDFSFDEVLVKGDPNQLKQVFLNIMKNAIEVMTSGGTISVIIRQSITKANCVSVFIKDEGPGIADDEIARIGEPFFTTKENGTGLGMAVSFKIIQNHNGFIHVESVEHVGTTFEVRMPMIKALVTS